MAVALASTRKIIVVDSIFVHNYFCFSALLIANKGDASSLHYVKIKWKRSTLFSSAITEIFIVCKFRRCVVRCSLQLGIGAQ